MVDDQVLISRVLPIAVMLTVVLYLGGALFPIVGALIGLAALAPGVYLRFQTSLRWPPTVMVAAVAGLLFLGFRTPAPVAVYFLEFGLSSLVFDYFLRRRRPGVETLFVSAAITTFLVVMLMVWLSYNRGVTPVFLSEQFLLANVAEVSAIYERAGVTAAQLAVLRQAAEEVAVWAGTLFPSLLFIAFFTVQGFGFGAARLFYNRLHSAPPELLKEASSFSHMQVPGLLVWPLIVCLGGLLLLPLSGMPRFLFFNGAGLLLFTYLIQGLAIMQFAFEVYAVSRVQRFFICFFFLAFQFLFIFLVLLGIFDTWLDVRLRIVRRQQRLGR
ncbi:MAG: DUF2232 domain-containing protein [Deltaproteobacteria bacterium]|nr:DUF2232 domain-containing protein [Deltaproteobacteria bacterium]